MKQARAFGVGVVLATQNPVDIDYKAITNAGTWMIGRLQTDRDKSRLLDGMTAAAGNVDISAVSDTISGLGKREFVLRRAGKDKPEVFTSRWAMSYLRGPLDREQIRSLMAPQQAAAAQAGPAASATPAPSGRVSVSDVSSDQVYTQAGSPAPRAAAPAPAGAALADDETTLAPEVASGTPVRWADPASPWLRTVGAADGGSRHEAAAVARVRLRYDDEKAGLVEDTEWEAVIFPLAEQPDPTTAVAVDYDDRDLRDAAPDGVVFVLPKAPVKDRRFWTDLQRNIVDNLVRSQTMEVFVNRDLKLYSRTGESQDDFVKRCTEAADAKADDEAAGLRDKYEAKAKTIQDQLATAQDRAELLKDQQRSSRVSEVASVAGSILGSFLGGKKSASALSKVAGSLGGMATRRGRSAAAGDRVDAVANKAERLQQDLADVEAELAKELQDIHSGWEAKAANVQTVPVTLEKTDVSVAQLALVWLPVG